MTIEEDRAWDWGTSYGKEQLIELEWGDKRERNVHEQKMVEGIDGVVNESLAVKEDLIAREGKHRSPLVWLANLTFGESLSEEDEANMALMMTPDLTSFEEAVNSSKLRLSMDEEIKFIERNHTWNLVELPPNGKKIGMKWIYKTKLNELEEIDKYKGRLVMKGYTQQHGIDYTEVYAPVAKMDTVRMIIAFVAQQRWKLYQLDVKYAFLHGELKEDIFIEQSKGYEKKGSEHIVYKLKKALYRLKQAPRDWFSLIESYFSKEGFESNPNE
ncbi:MAG: reverse transcriptase domain-containing protein [Candidatus Phytoplasma australasiaticum]|nr:reverse transcriptase domain-containing protein [Candidatus Phytoplasma australasiaticum]